MAGLYVYHESMTQITDVGSSTLVSGSFFFSRKAVWQGKENVGSSEQKEKWERRTKVARRVARRGLVSTFDLKGLTNTD